MSPDAIIVTGAEETAVHMHQRARRAADMAPAFEEMVPALEKAELRLFDSYQGKYVLTGATKESLTQSDANGAIRAAHGERFVFGTSIWYAKFQGTTGVGSHGPPSAILAVPPGAGERAAKIGAAYVVDGPVGELA